MSNLNESVKSEKIEKSTDSKKDNKIDFETEMKTGCISKGNQPKESTITGQKAVKTRTIVKQYNEQGQRLTKKGTVDRRAETSKQNMLKSARYKDILAKKQEEKKSQPILTPIVESDDDSDDDLEFSIETVDIPEEIKQVAPTPVAPPQPNPYIENEISKRKKMDEEMFKLQEENKKLRDGIYFSNHLQTIDRMARVVKLKF
jgi:hypothetical protein